MNPRVRENLIAMLYEMQSSRGPVALQVGIRIDSATPAMAKQSQTKKRRSPALAAWRP